MSTESYDANSNYDTANKKYVVPITGYYHFSATVLYQGQASSPKLVSLSKNSASAEYVRLAENPNCTGNLTIGGSVDLYLSAGDYLCCLGYSTEAKTVLATNQYTRWAGYLISV